jgi:S1-C subfamily serine protease
MKEKSTITKIAKKACPAVISIVVSKDLPKMEGFQSLPFGVQQLMLPKKKNGKHQIKIGGGSGFIISKDGLVLTCNHVVKDTSASYTVILSPEEKYEAQILAKDPLIDLAILKIKGKKFPYLELGDSSKTELGESVVAIGNPLGEFDDTLSAGIVSGLSRKITAYGRNLSQSNSLRGLIQTDAAINPGNSGGPLVDMEGKVIGINTAIVQGSQNIGFAIPINYTKENIKEVKKYGKIKKPFLGIKYFILNEKISHLNKIPVNYGAMILRERLGEEAIVDGSPADKAGLRAYDIILSCNGEKITKENSLDRVLQKHNIGDVVNLKILREDKEIEAKVELTERK